MLIDEKPAGLAPTPNDLDNVPDDELGPLPEMIRLSGRDLFIMEAPPATGEYIKAEIIMEARDLVVKAPDADGAVDHNVRLMRYVGAKLTVLPYKPEVKPDKPADDDPDTPAMVGRDGQVVDDLGGDPDGDDIEGVDGDYGDDDDGAEDLPTTEGAEDAEGEEAQDFGPGFSHTKGK